MGLFQSYKLRLLRKKLRIRSIRRRRVLKNKRDNTAKIKKGDLLLFSTMRNEHVRLPYFLKYYREMGINHFLIVDNDSDDGSIEYLLEQPDVSLWHTKDSYKRARYGMDWVNWLQMRYGHGHWTLVVDPDEYFIYPFCDSRPLQALTDWLDSSSIKSFSAMLLDMYPKGKLNEASYRKGQNPLEVANWFDSGNYTITKNKAFGNLWIQGGARTRVFFPKKPEKAPALNKTPLVKWDRKYVYVSSTHMLLPRGLNLTYDEWGGEKACGVLLHTKFLDTLQAKTVEELKRGQHYSASIEYKAYSQNMTGETSLWVPTSERYINWRQLEVLGLMSKGHWA